MRFWSVAPLAAAAFAAVGSASGLAFANEGMRISGPHVHENLAVYFVHGEGASGPVPFSLAEALERGNVRVIETGNVNELQIENVGTEEVFIQAGDIVKGGKQDRVLTVSFILPGKSGRVPIASFCVEQGRWSPRAKEDASKFSSALEAMPSRAALLAIATPPTAAPRQPADVGRVQMRQPNDVAVKQMKVWESVAKTQEKLGTGLGASVASPQSASSLQLTLENSRLKEARAAYMQALEGKGLKESDVLGYIIAINGKVSTASLYSSNGLFRKMWSKQLAAAVTEAIGEKSEAKPVAAPAPDAASKFLDEAERGKPHERVLSADMRQEIRDGDGALYSEARRADGKWVHRSYLAK
jgi:hypothetical protein